MLGIWADLPWWGRMAVGLAVMVAGIVVIFKSLGHGPVAGELIVDDPGRYEMIIGFVLTGIGFGLLALGGRSAAEKKGYKF